MHIIYKSRFFYFPSPNLTESFPGETEKRNTADMTGWINRSLPKNYQGCTFSKTILLLFQPKMRLDSNTP